MAGRIPEQFIDDLVARIDIVDLIESYLPLRKAGREFHALCPFHGEKTPSFTVSREKQFYHCFGCGAHGTAIGFLMAYRNLEFPEAVEELAGIAGLEIPREARRDHAPAARELYIALRACPRLASNSNCAGAGRERAVDYFKGRGVTGGIISASISASRRMAGATCTMRSPARASARTCSNARGSSSSATAAATTTASAIASCFPSTIGVAGSSRSAAA